MSSIEMRWSSCARHLSNDQMRRQTPNWIEYSNSLLEAMHKMEIISSQGKSVTFYRSSIRCPKIIHSTPCHDKCIATRNNSFRHCISLQCCSDPDWIVPMQMHSIATRNENTIQNRQIVFLFRLLLRWSSERRTRKLNYFRFYFLTSLTHTHTRMEEATPVRTGKVQLRLAIVVVNRHLPIESNCIPNGKPHRKKKKICFRIEWNEQKTKKISSAIMEIYICVFPLLDCSLYTQTHIVHQPTRPHSVVPE